jgi:outer membrane protein assembly factor BamB
MALAPAGRYSGDLPFLMRNPAAIILPLLCAAGAAAALSWWLEEAPLPGLRAPTPGGSLAERRAAVARPPASETSGEFNQGSGVAGESRDAWTGFRGPGQANIARPSVPLAETWPANGPPVRWTVTVGDGHAGPIVRGGCVYLLDYDEVRRGDLVRCLSLTDGAELWRRFYPVHTKRNHGISRTVPALDGPFLVTFGPQCQVRCLDARSGDHLWAIDLVSRYQARVPLWYAGQCPLIDAGVAVLAVGGERVLLAGIECATGSTRWETPNPGGWNMSHASVAVAEFHGVRQYLHAALGGIAGVAAEGEATGDLLWTTTAFAPGVVAPTPVPLPGNRFLQVAGHGSGGALFQVDRLAGGAWQVTEVERFSRRTFACEQQTPILRDGVLFAVLPSDAGDHRQELTCMNPNGEVLWHSGPRDRFGLGPFLAVGEEQMLLMNDTGVLTLARATPAGYVRLARHALFPKGRDAWGPMALVDGWLLLRDSTRLMCVDLR